MRNEIGIPPNRGLQGMSDSLREGRGGATRRGERERERYLGEMWLEGEEWVSGPDSRPQVSRWIFVLTSSAGFWSAAALGEQKHGFWSSLSRPDFGQRPPAHSC